MNAVVPDDNKELNNDKRNKRVESAWREKCPDDFLVFAGGLTIDAVDGPRVFHNCMARFQLDAFEDVAPALEAIRDGEKPPKPYNRFWWERTKKAAKDSDLAICVLWLVAFAKRPFYGQVGAADRGQAAIVRERLSNLLHHNPWLNDYVEVVQWQIKSKAKTQSGDPLARIDIMAADIAGSHGGTPDILIINELSHVSKWAFVETLMNNADGVPRGIVIIATNAGYIGTEPERWRQTAMKNDNWAIRIWATPAPWHSKEFIREAKLRNRESEFRRLWTGRWISGVGTALSEHAINRCFTLDGPLDLPERGWDYIAGLDLGVSHDHSGLIVVGVHEETQTMKVAWFRGFEPVPGGEVDLIAVEDACRAMYGLFRIGWLGYDPAAGGSYMAQRLRRDGVPMHEVSFSSPKNREAMADALVQAVEAKILTCYDDADGRLRRDFGKFNIKESSFGRKLEAVSDMYGHADVGMALALCLPKAREMLGLPGQFLGPDDVIGTTVDEKSMAEVREGMSGDLAEIYDHYDKKIVEEKRKQVWGDDDF